MTLFGIIWMVIIGTIAGVLAKLLYRQSGRMGWPDTLALGIAGSIFGGWIGGLLGMGNGKPGGVFTATIGALLILYIYNRVILALRR